MGAKNKIIRAIYKSSVRSATLLHRIFSEPIIKGSFAECGQGVRVARGCSFSGIQNVFVGSHVMLGTNTRILTTRARVIIGDHVMMASGVNIITGNHRVDIKGRYMMDIKDCEKREEDDQDVVIEDDVWVGTGAIILKGVTIGRGSVVAAGSVVTRSIPPYSIVGGVPARVIKKRFTDEEIEEHEKILFESEK